MCYLCPKHTLIRQKCTNIDSIIVDIRRCLINATEKRCRRKILVGEQSLCNLFLLIKFFLPRLLSGQIVEFGSFKGGSAIFMAALAKEFLPGAQVIGFDTFTGMPPTDRSIDEHRPGGFADVDLQELRQYAKRVGLDSLTFVQGKFEDTAHAALQRLGKVVLCHIDCDIRSSVEYAYDAVKPYMAAGGYWVFDDLLAADCLARLRGLGQNRGLGVC